LAKTQLLPKGNCQVQIDLPRAVLSRAGSTEIDRVRRESEKAREAYVKHTKNHGCGRSATRSIVSMDYSGAAGTCRLFSRLGKMHW